MQRRARRPRAVARAARRTGARLARPRRRPPRAAPSAGTLPGRRRTHPRIPRRGRRLPGEPDATLRGVAGRTGLGAGRPARRPASGALRRLPGPRERAAGRQLARALPAPARPARRDAAHQGDIVDLERNDLGRVCEVGTVVVERYAAVESHPTVHHLVSTIAGRLRADVGLADLLRATFPGGSITGAPKVRAMEIIRELEEWPRGPYTGTFGFLDPRGDLELGLAIRTAIVSGGAVHYHAGGGIVADSDPEREGAEAWLKTAALRRALRDQPRDGLELCSSG
ncbi:MAG: hypothetical protein E6J75_00190 [Deltaproteobacteria bacterium]|nr:MAG: hypothetical protein E6J75_00190 [Deltaproteobacteria bacterium]